MQQQNARRGFLLPQPPFRIGLDFVVKMTVPDACRAQARCSCLSRSSSMMARTNFVDAGGGGEAEGDGAWRRGLAASPSLRRHRYNTSRLATMIRVVAKPRRKTVSGTRAARWLKRREGLPA